MKELAECRILVTPTSYGQSDPSLITELEKQVGQVIYNTTGRALNSTEVADLLPGIDGYIAGLDHIDRDALRRADSLKVIARYGVGVDQVDLQAAREHNIIVTNTPSANSASVAELTIAFLLDLGRNLVEAVSTTRTGNWSYFQGVSLESKVIGLLGFGSIARQVAQRLRGFRCAVRAFDIREDIEAFQKYEVTSVSFDQLLHESDFLSLHLPLTNETRTIVNSAFLNKMKRGSYLVNTARGELIDEGALLAALRTGQVAGAALDVLSQEPAKRDNPLLTAKQVITTPHIGSHTDTAINHMGWASLQSCLAVLRGEEPINRVG